MLSSLVKKNGVSIKMKKSDLGKVGVDDEIANFLRKHESDAYTIRGIMYELYNVPTDDMQGSWSAWPKSLPTLYGRINRGLERLRKAEKISKTRKGPADFWAWKES